MKSIIIHKIRSTLCIIACILVSINGLIPSTRGRAIRSSQSYLSSSYKSEDNAFTRTAAPEVALSTDVSNLPDAFSDAVRKAAMRTIDCITAGKKRIRIDFDTSIGDQTYTSIKNSIPLMKELSVILSQEMDLTMTMGEDDEVEEVATGELAILESQISKESTDVTAEVSSVAPAVPTPVAQKVEIADKTMRIFFPDMGQAALARRDWKMGTDVSEVPPCVYTANIKNDGIQTTDKVVVIICPLASEADDVQRIMAICTASNVPLVLINPDLINMDQGFGYSKSPLNIFDIFIFCSFVIQFIINISVVNVYFLLYVDLLLHKHTIEFEKIHQK